VSSRATRGRKSPATEPPKAKDRLDLIEDHAKGEHRLTPHKECPACIRFGHAARG
jgi:hypothetical protein